ncbi:MAG: DUF1549 domain-containing protein [Planctomycetota bacterium]
MVTSDTAGFASAAEPYAILPPRLTLDSPAARQRLIVQRTGGSQVNAGLTWSSSDENIVRVVEQVALPVGNGTARLTATIRDADGRTVQVAVDATVSGQDQPTRWSFRNHVEPVLSKSGCNGGACHGARAGQAGFRLTLFSYEPDADYVYLTRQANGRRIVPDDPGRSLLLTKPTGLIAHKGGVRFEPDSLEYRVLAEWIAQGTTGPAEDDPRIVGLDVYPTQSRQRVGDAQQLVVMARFSDGRQEDVTAWAKYNSLQSSVASVSERGRVEITGQGEGVVKIWYLNQNAIATLTVPYPDGKPDEPRTGATTDPAAPAAAGSGSPREPFAQQPVRNFVDRAVLAKLRDLNLPPSEPVDDATFLRRASLDTIGLLPTADETRAFLLDTSADKRDRLIEQLLARPEFVDYWAYKWSDLLLISGERLRPAALQAYYQWVRSKVATNTPWDQLVRELVTASGSTHEHGAANFFALHQDPEDMSETVAQAFLGLSINCARCHNHPLEKWTNDQYYGMANMFSRVRSKGWGGDFRNGDGLRVVFADTQGELMQPGKGKPQPPRPLDGATVPFAATIDRRVPLATWLTSAENPYFTRTIVNRIWAHFFKVGLVEKVDDMRLTNPASNEPLLAEAAQFLSQHQYDLKALMRVILQSAPYQRSSRALAHNRADERFYSRYYPRRLAAEVLLDAVSQVTAVPTEFKMADNKPYAKGTRALQLPDANVDSYFLKTFGRPERLITCDCERSDEPSMTQVLHMANGNTLNGKLQTPGNRLEQQLAAGAAPAAIIEELYLSALSRFPSDAEREQLLSALQETPAAERRVAFEDLYWSVLSSREFLFNH